MSRRCAITGKRTVAGRTYARRGLAKKKGGIGKHVSGVARRTFKPNLQTKRIWVPELKRYVKVRLSTRALRTLTQHGAYRTLLRAGLLKPPTRRKG